MSSTVIVSSGKNSNGKVWDIEQIENLVFNDPDDDGRPRTIRSYLIKLLLTLWREKECFNAKRPFGNSAWDWNIYRPLISNGIIDAVIDEDGFFERFSIKEQEKAHKIISIIISNL